MRLLTAYKEGKRIRKWHTLIKKHKGKNSMEIKAMYSGYYESHSVLVRRVRYEEFGKGTVKGWSDKASDGYKYALELEVM